MKSRAVQVKRLEALLAARNEYGAHWHISQDGIWIFTGLDKCRFCWTQDILPVITPACRTQNKIDKIGKTLFDFAEFTFCRGSRVIIIVFTNHNALRGESWQHSFRPSEPAFRA
jgi:hypothetical protein